MSDPMHKSFSSLLGRVISDSLRSLDLSSNDLGPAIASLQPLPIRLVSLSLAGSNLRIYTLFCI
jgi:hypothetical protein